MQQSIPKNSPVGKIIPHSVKPNLREMDTILYFTNLGKDVELICPSNTPHRKNADYIIESVVWEAKCPTTCNPRAIERLFYRASSQSENIIMGLRHLQNDTFAIKILEKCFKTTRRVRRLHIINKSGQLKSYRK